MMLIDEWCRANFSLPQLWFIWRWLSLLQELRGDAPNRHSIDPIRRTER
jgi:hypothetical protein